MRLLSPAAVLGSALLLGCTASPRAPSAYPPAPPYPSPPLSGQAPAPTSEPAALPPLPTQPEAARRSPPRQLADGAQLPALKGLLTAADAALAKGDVELAAASLERAQRLAPQSALVYQKLASVRLRQKRPAEAEQLARKALGYSSSNVQQAALWQVIASARQMRGMQAEAHEARSRAAALQAGASP